MKKLMSFVSVCVVLSLLLSACNGSDSGGRSKAVADTAKYNAYVELGNFMSGWLDLNVYAYAEKFGFDEEIQFKKDFDPKTFEGAVMTPIIKGFFDKVDKTLEYASTEPSYGAADETMKALSPKLKDFLTTINEVDAYYRSKGFAEDDFAKGKELHKKLIAQYHEYTDLANTFFADMIEITKQKEQDELERLKNDDYMLRYYAKSVVMKAKDIQNDFIAAKVDDSNLSEYDAAAFKEKYDALTEDMNQFLEYAKDKSRMEKEGIQSFWRFDQAIPGVKASATDILQFLQKKTPTETKSSSGKVTTHDRIGLIEQYDNKVFDMISCYNNMIK